MIDMPKRALLLLAVLVCLVTWPNAVHALDQAFVVIAAPGATEHKLTRDTVARIFMRRQNYWENGDRTQAVNLPVNHPLRRLFSQTVLGSAPEALEDYWRDMYFHGVLPPHVLASEEAVVLFVSSTPGAIGYVSSCSAGQRLNIVLIVGEVADCQR
jgi:ABC-type phosphate transport system substrate-binding protein